MVWMDTKILLGTKVLDHPNYAGNDSPYHSEVTEGKQIVVPFVNNRKVNENVKKHTSLTD